MTLNNLERWRFYTKNLFTTENYITFGWLFTVTAALQRRVWYGDIEGQPTFCNLYGVLAGPPAVGKGMVLSEITKFLSHHTAVRGHENDENLSEFDAKKPPTPIFPKAPEDVTYQAFTQDLSETVQRVRYPKPNGSKGLYSHSSMYFCLEELESLFKKGDNDERLHKFLLTAWDCKDARYKTKHQGDFEVRNPCVSIVAGTTPSSLGKLFAKGILTDGFMSRTLLMFENRSNRTTFELEQPDDEMKSAKSEILIHLKALSKLFGPILKGPGVKEYLQDWFDTKFLPGRAKIPAKLETYYERKPIQILKLAAAFWFTDNTDMTIQLPAFEAAIDFLELIEPNMIRGMRVIGKNELSKDSQDVLRYITLHDECSMVELLTEFNADLKLLELREIIDELLFTGKIVEVNGKYTSKE